MGNDADLCRRRLAARIAEERRKRAALSRGPDVSEGGSPEDSDAMRDFLTRLTGGLGLGGRTRPEAAPPPGPRAVLPFPRPEPVPASAPEPESEPEASGAEELDALAAALEAECDLDRLPGAGPGLVWALRRAGVRRLADLAELAPEELAARLGPVGPLVPAERWIGVARAGAAA